MQRSELAAAIRATALLQGQFQLRSGGVSAFYWDKYRFESDPRLLWAISQHLLPLLPAAFDRLAGLELGGIPLATALSLASGRPALYVRKTAKTYGTCNLVEGGYASGETVVVIEDVITSGGQVCASVQQMRDLGLVVPYVLCVIDREQGGRAAIEALGCSCTALFTQTELDSLASSPT
ncbi:MAG: orotate phosphoribosyltransferase [Chloroflexaceae bacterium]|nr:orotate phosphoribosyltransferase [Chloroflexaceae bacterium]